MHDFDEIYNKLPLTEIDCAQTSIGDIIPLLGRLDSLRATAIDLAGNAITGCDAFRPAITLVPFCLWCLGTRYIWFIYANSENSPVWLLGPQIPKKLTAQELRPNKTETVKYRRSCGVSALRTRLYLELTFVI